MCFCESKKQKVDTMRNIIIIYALFFMIPIIYFIDKTFFLSNKFIQENKETKEDIIKYDFDSTNKLEMDVKFE